MPSQPLQVPGRLVEFDTARVQAKSRIPLWEVFNHRWLAPLRCRTFTAGDLEAKVRCTELGDVRITEMRGQGHFVERTREHIAAGNRDEVYLLVLLKGEGNILHSGGTDRIFAGDAQIYDARVPAVFGLLGEFHLIAVRIGKDSLPGPTAVASSMPTVLRAADGGPRAEYTRRATLLARSALREPLDAPEAAERTMKDLFGRLLGAGDAAESYWITANDFVRRNLHDPDLDVSRVAKAVGVSTRHLARVFAEHGSTVAQFIQTARLQHARTLLLDDSRAAASIADIARLSGFRSASQFSRSFRGAYGARASDIRRGSGH
ncbi:helix-turn-helix domain-containing protein [Streptomyces sp. NPDC085946]|uniref:AraC family transcriptional regulator n=1 Tax=Streptomyces sp. NPDC085946 TaxID=3365744 RepID=UPI0037D74C2A